MKLKIKKDKIKESFDGSSCRNSLFSDMSDEDRIVTSVRVRPLSESEIQNKSKVIISADLEGKYLSILDPLYLDLLSSNSETERKKLERNFNYDNIFSSALPETKYHKQIDIYKKCGEPLIEHCLQGYNCSMLAYGQTGSGKTYTMVGNPLNNGEEYGLTIRLCRALLRTVQDINNKQRYNLNSIKMKENCCHIDSIKGMISMQSSPSYSEPNITNITMHISYIEIYNERVYDLLSDKVEPSRVREKPDIGAYVEDLSMCPITSYEQMEALFERGNKHRAVAYTLMNSTSSRSHALLTVCIDQTIEQAHAIDGCTTIHRKSKITLVDLAGSERSSETGATGSRLKEANSINRSLSTLGDVVNALSDPSRKDNHVPYRNSMLTWLLKDSIGGNSKCTILATISPTQQAYQETLTTLRFMERVKSVVTHALVNDQVVQESSAAAAAAAVAAAAVIQKLKAEVQRLRRQLSHTEGTDEGSSPAASSVTASPADSLSPLAAPVESCVPLSSEILQWEYRSLKKELQELRPVRDQLEATQREMTISVLRADLLESQVLVLEDENEQLRRAYCAEAEQRQAAEAGDERLLTLATELRGCEERGRETMRRLREKEEEAEEEAKRLGRLQLEKRELEVMLREGQERLEAEGREHSGAVCLAAERHQMELEDLKAKCTATVKQLVSAYEAGRRIEVESRPSADGPGLPQELGAMRELLGWQCCKERALLQRIAGLEQRLVEQDHSPAAAAQQLPEHIASLSSLVDRLYRLDSRYRAPISAAATGPRRLADSFEDISEALITTRLELAESLDRNRELLTELREVEIVMCDYKHQVAVLKQQLEERHAIIHVMSKQHNGLRRFHLS